MLKKVFKYFLRGLIYLVPLVLTIWILYESIVYANKLFLPLVDQINFYTNFDAPWLGTVFAFASIFVLLVFIGYAGSVLIATPINSLFRKLLKRAPLVKTIYSSIKDLMNTFVGNKKGFSEPVLVKVYENSTIERIGFVTSEDVKSLNIEEGKVLVYLPHSYAISGQLFVIEKKYVKKIDCSASEVMKLVVSAGITEIEKK